MTREESISAEIRREKTAGFEVRTALVYEYLEAAIDKLDGDILGSPTNAVVGNHISSRKTLVRCLYDLEAIFDKKMQEEFPSED